MSNADPSSLIDSVRDELREDYASVRREWSLGFAAWRLAETALAIGLILRIAAHTQAYEYQTGDDLTDGDVSYRLTPRVVERPMSTRVDAGCRLASLAFAAALAPVAVSHVGLRHPLEAAVVLPQWLLLVADPVVGFAVDATATRGDGIDD